MAGCGNDGSMYIEAVLTFSRERLLYDISNCCYIEGSIMETESAHERHMVQGAVEEGNVERIMRVLDLNVARCREYLYGFTKCDVERAELDNSLGNVTTYGIVLKLPWSYSQTTLDLLERLVHEYLVSGTVYEWLSITDTKKADVWREKWKEAEDGIEKCMHSRRERVRRKVHPF